MGDSYTAQQFSSKIFKTAKNLSDPAVKKRFMANIFVEMDKIFVTQVHADLHKDHFTNWPRKGNKAAIKPRHFMPGDQPKDADEHVFGPQNRSFGPLWVAEYGRHRDPQTGAAMHGPLLGPLLTRGGIKGVRKISRKKTRRWNGATKPMYTWRKTTTRIQGVVPPRISTEYTKIMYESFK